ncbi:MAG: SCO family protein [Planctomycetota bacterium]|nr:MAG: SCO family protein [Planctomycetota bacterium]
MWSSPITWAVIFMGLIFAFAVGTQSRGGSALPETAPFELVEATGSGETVNEDDLQGKVSLLYFGFMYCPDVCPTSLRSIADALTLLEGDAEHVQAWFITVDPERDTPEALREFMPMVDDRIRAFTGDTAQLSSAKEAFAIVAERTYPAQNPEHYLYNHTSSTMLVDQNGRLIRRIPYGTQAQAIADAVRSLLP